jgi:hypothetical protein
MLQVEQGVMLQAEQGMLQAEQGMLQAEQGMLQAICLTRE